MSEHKELIVGQQQSGTRIDKVITDASVEISRSQVQGWIKESLVLVNGSSVKSNYKCQEGDRIEWSIPEVVPVDVQPENIPLSILYEDEVLLVVNKPKGMVVHPSAGHQTGTLVHALLYHCNDLSGINGELRPGIVHRIDKDTSGLLLVAKNDQAHIHLSNQLSEKSITRIYEAIVHGEISHDKGTIDAPIGRDPNDRQKMAVVDGGKDAITHFEVKERFEDFSYVWCKLETGRTHQIRVHMNYIGHPLAGDPKYGPKKTLSMNGQALHARVLGFTHPVSGEWLQFETDPPKEFEDILHQLRSNH